MSGDLISRKALIKAILEERDKIPLTITERYAFGCETPNKHGQSMRGGIRKALRCVEEATAVDVVEVVRCKDCKHINLNDESCEQCDDIHEECGVCMYSWNCVSFDDFCSYGERRSE